MKGMAMYDKFSSWLQVLMVMTAVFLTACENKWEQIPDDQLAAKASECASEDDPSSAMIQVCKNYARECERRRELGFYIC
jgi:hypothetical protein